MAVSVFFDSNIFFLKDGNDYSRSWILEQVEKYSDLVELADVYDEVRFVISEIVVRETHRNQCEKYKDKTDRLKRIVLPDWRFEHDTSVADYKDWLQGHFDEHYKRGLFGMVHFFVAPVPENCLKSIVERALAKRAPFEGKGKASDKGFKDALIWETLLQYKHDNKADEIVLITKDSRLSDASISDEFEKEFGQAITICSDPESFQEYLNTLNERRGVDAAPPLVEIENSSKMNDLMRSLVFYNMEAIAEAGGLSYQDDTKYNMRKFRVSESDEGHLRCSSVLWSTDSDGDSSHCNIEFDIARIDDEESLLCSVNDRVIDIEYDEVDLEVFVHEL